MGKTKNKESSEVEYLRGENRRLKRKLKQLERQKHFYEHVVDEFAEEIEVKELCPECTKSELLSIELPHMILVQCQLCEYRRKDKK